MWYLWIIQRKIIIHPIYWCCHFSQIFSEVPEGYILQCIDHIIPTKVKSTRMHSSRMCSACSLTIFPGSLPSLGGGDLRMWPQSGGDLSWRGGDLNQRGLVTSIGGLGTSVRGGVLSQGVTSVEDRPHHSPCDHVTYPIMHLISHSPPPPPQCWRDRCLA